MRTLATFGALLLLAPVAARAQCKVSGSSNEGKLLAFYVAPVAFGPASSPEARRPGSIRLGIEAEYLPKPSAEIQRTGKCFLQKTENTSISPVFGRPRVTIWLPWGFAIEGSYLPPIRIADAKPNLGSLALSHNAHFEVGRSGGVDAIVRAHTTFGNVKGPITCPRGALQTTDASKPCYGTAPSNDTFRPNMLGAEIVVGVRARSNVSYYGGIGANRIDPHFQVGFTDGTGHIDRTEVELQRVVTRLALMMGLTSKSGRALDYGVQVYSVPADATTLRLHAGLNFR